MQLFCLIYHGNGRIHHKFAYYSHIKRSAGHIHSCEVNPNADIYTAQKCPFVMGTTGGDRDKLMKVVFCSLQSVHTQSCHGQRHICSDSAQHVQTDSGFPGVHAQKKNASEFVRRLFASLTNRRLIGTRRQEQQGSARIASFKLA
eukprot:5988446-Amphidinium_carterae.1